MYPLIFHHYLSPKSVTLLTHTLRQVGIHQTLDRFEVRRVGKKDFSVHHAPLQIREIFPKLGLKKVRSRLAKD